MCCKWKAILKQLDTIDKKVILHKLDTDEYDIYVLDYLFWSKVITKDEYLIYLQKLIDNLYKEIRYAELLLDATVNLDLLNVAEAPIEE